VLDVLENTDHCSREKEVILIVHGNDNEELCVSWFGEKLLTQGEALLKEIRWITSRGGVTHMCEFVTLRVLGVGDLVEQFRCNRTVEHKVTLEQLNFFDGLPSPDWSRTRCRGNGHVLLVIIAVWVLRAERVVLLEYWFIIVIRMLGPRVVS
jgi:hypothetical protein